MNFLKSLGIGLVIIILLPLLLLGASVVGLVLLIEWVVVFVKGAIRFFKGDTFFEPLPEDLIVEEMKAKELRDQTAPEPTPAPVPQPQQQNVYVTNYYQYPNQNPQAPQPMPQPNPYQNSPLDAPVHESIPQNHPGMIDNGVESVPYQEHEAPREAIPLNIADDEGGTEE